MPDPSAHHVGFTVSDLERSVEFYRGVLGLDVLDRFEVGGDAFATAVDVPGAEGSFVHLDADGVRVELVAYEPVGDDHPGADLDQPGAAHLGLTVEDVDAFVDGLPADVEPVSEPQTTVSGTRLVFLRDPDDNLVELLED